MEKICKTCQTSKPFSEFYDHKYYSDGKELSCKKCRKQNVKAARQKNLENYQAYDRKRNKTPERLEAKRESVKRNPEAPRAAKKRWAERNREKRAAHTIVGNAVRDGRLIKEPCHICGDETVQAHHPDYSQPLPVVWVCDKHHKEIHKQGAKTNDR